MPMWVSIRVWICGMAAILVCGLIAAFCIEWSALDLEDQRIELLRARHEARMMLRDAVREELNGRYLLTPGDARGLVVSLGLVTYYDPPPPPSYWTFSTGPGISFSSGVPDSARSRFVLFRDVSFRNNGSEYAALIDGRWWVAIPGGGMVRLLVP